MNKKLENFKITVKSLLEDEETTPGKVINIVLLGVNLLACALFVIDSYPNNPIPTLVSILNFFVMIFFIVEYILRLWTANGKISYIFSFYGIVDLISIIPFLMPTRKLNFVSALKVLRILRFIRYLESESFFFGKLSAFQLQVWRTIFSIFTIIFISSGFILFAEQQDPANATIKTFDQAFYFCVITLATVGYGDFVPITFWGRWISVIMIIGGAIVIPWQAGKLIKMLIAGEAGKKPVICPKCGLKGHDFDASHCKACGSIIYQEYEGDI